MPPKTKRERQLQEARAAKCQADLTEQPGPSGLNTSASSTIEDTLSDYQSEEDLDFNPESEEYDEEASVHSHVQERVQSLGRDDLHSLSILLWYLLVNIL